MVNNDRIKGSVAEPWELKYLASFSDEEVLASIQKHRDFEGRLKISSFEGDPETDVFCLIASGVTVAVFVLVTLGFYLFNAEWSVWYWVVLSVFSIVPAFFAVILGIGVFAERFSGYRNYKRMVGEAFKRGLGN